MGNYLAVKKWRERHPDKVREESRKRNEKRRTDPIAHEKYKIYQREYKRRIRARMASSASETQTENQ